MTLRSESVNLAHLVEIFGIITAAAFVFSALLGGAMFYLAYNINYYSVATVSDVVMGGFMTIGYSMFTVVFAICAITLWSLAGNILLDLASDRLSRKIRSQIRSIFLLHHRYTWMDFLFSRMAISVMIFGLILSSVILCSLTYLFSGIPAIMQTGLRLYDQSAPAACQGGPVEWLGTSAAVVRCGEGVIVIRDPAQLTMHGRDRDQVRFLLP